MAHNIARKANVENLYEAPGKALLKHLDDLLSQTIYSNSFLSTEGLSDLKTWHQLVTTHQKHAKIGHEIPQEYLATLIYIFHQRSQRMKNSGREYQPEMIDTKVPWCAYKQRTMITDQIYMKFGLYLINVLEKNIIEARSKGQNVEQQIKKLKSLIATLKGLEGYKFDELYYAIGNRFYRQDEITTIETLQNIVKKDAWSKEDKNKFFELTRVDIIKGFEGSNEDFFEIPADSIIFLPTNDNTNIAYDKSEFTIRGQGDLLYIKRLSKRHNWSDDAKKTFIKKFLPNLKGSRFDDIYIINGRCYSHPSHAKSVLDQEKLNIQVCQLQAGTIGLDLEKIESIENLFTTQKYFYDITKLIGPDRAKSLQKIIWIAKKHQWSRQEEIRFKGCCAVKYWNTESEYELFVSALFNEENKHEGFGGLRHTSIDTYVLKTQKANPASMFEILNDGPLDRDEEKFKTKLQRSFYNKCRFEQFMRYISSPEFKGIPKFALWDEKNKRKFKMRTKLKWGGLRAEKDFFQMAATEEGTKKLHLSHKGYYYDLSEISLQYIKAIAKKHRWNERDYSIAIYKWVELRKAYFKNKGTPTTKELKAQKVTSSQYMMLITTVMNTIEQLIEYIHPKKVSNRSQASSAIATPKPAIDIMAPEVSAKVKKQRVIRLKEAIKAAAVATTVQNVISASTTRTETFSSGRSSY